MECEPEHMDIYKVDAIVADFEDQEPLVMDPRQAPPRAALGTSMGINDTSRSRVRKIILEML